MAVTTMIWVTRRRRRKMTGQLVQRMGSLFAQPGTAFLAIHPARQQVVEAVNLDIYLGTKRSLATAQDVMDALTDESAALFSHQLHKVLEGTSCPPITLKTREHFYLECMPLLADEAGGPKADAPVMFMLKDVSPQYRHTQMMESENEALKTDVRRYSSILNSTDELVWLRDKKLAITYCNLAYTKTVEEAGDTAEAGVPELHKQGRRLAERAREAGAPQKERRHLVVNGTRRLFQIHEVPLLDGNMIGFARDITELEETQQEIDRHISAQADFLESSTNAIAIFGKDMRLRFFNHAYVALWKFDEAWLDTKPSFGEVLEVMREKRKLPEQANFKAFKEQRIRMFTDLIDPQEEIYYLPDGKTLRVVALPHSTGGLMFAYEDVTDRLALERSYNTLIAVQRETLDNLHEGIIVFGEDGRMRLYNPVFVHLWQLDEGRLQDQMHISEVMDMSQHLFRTEDWKLYKQGFIGRVQSRSLYATRLERTDGSVLNMSVVPLPDGGTLLTFTDITDSTLVERSLREKNDALQAADRLKTEFLANVSYELRSPLTSISGFSEMLRQDYFGELTERQREYVEGIHESSQHLMHLINDILDLASIEAGYMTLDIKEVDIQMMLRSVLSLLNERMKRFSIQAVLACPIDIGSMRADETRIRQVLFHLLSNAVKYSPEDGKVTLGAAREGDRIKFWVSDEGQGIAEQEQEAVFAKFYRGSASTSTSGTGLGLSMVKSFIELHGGQVLLDSRPGHGTTVTCLLPQRAADSAPDAKSKLHDPVPVSA